jgi:hypothetical protein
MSRNPPDWAYQRAGELHNAFADGTGNGIKDAYGDLKGAFALYISEHEKRSVAQEERENIAAAVQRMHIARGCCLGTFAVPCPYKGEQNTASVIAARRKVIEEEKADFAAFQSAELK